jgi:hypothetical protein
MSQIDTEGISPKKQGYQMSLVTEQGLGIALSSVLKRGDKETLKIDWNPIEAAHEIIQLDFPLETFLKARNKTSSIPRNFDKTEHQHNNQQKTADAMCARPFWSCVSPRRFERLSAWISQATRHLMKFQR